MAGEIKERFMVIIDHENLIYVLQNESLYRLNKEKRAEEGLAHAGILLQEHEKEIVLELEDFVENIEDKFLETKFWYSKSSKRKIIYSGRSDLYFIFEWERRSQNLTIHPFRDFDTIFLGEKENDVESIEKAIVLEMGLIEKDPVLHGILLS